MISLSGGEILDKVINSDLFAAGGLTRFDPSVTSRFTVKDMTNNNLENLFTALLSPEASARRQAALALGADRDESVVAPLLAQLAQEQDPRVLEDLTWALVQHADKARGALASMLGDEDPRQRRTAAHVLSKVANPADFDAVAPLVSDPDGDVAIKAYRAAANTGGVRAVETLVACLGDGDLLQRDALSTALASIGEASVAPLVAALESAEAPVREHAAEALGHLGGGEAAAAAEALETAAADPEPNVRLTAVAALGQLDEAADAGLSRLVASADAMVARVATRLVADRQEKAQA